MGLQYGDCPLMGGGLVKVLRVVIVKNCVTVGSVRRSGYPYREKRRRHVTNNGERHNDV